MRGLVGWLVAAGMGLAGAVQAAGNPCAVPEGNLLGAVCSDSELVSLMTAGQRAIGMLLGRISAAQRQAFADDQTAWIGRTEAQCGLRGGGVTPAQKTCLITVMTARNRYIAGYAPGSGLAAGTPVTAPPGRAAGAAELTFNPDGTVTTRRIVIQRSPDGSIETRAGSGGSPSASPLRENDPAAEERAREEAEQRRKEAQRQRELERQAAIVRAGYKPATVEDFLLDGKRWADDGAKVAVKGFYGKLGNVNYLIAGRWPYGNMLTVGLLIDSADRDTRRRMIACQSQIASYGMSGCMNVTLYGRAIFCEASNAAGSHEEPCLDVERGDFGH